MNSTFTLSRHGACDEDNVENLIQQWRAESDDVFEFNLSLVVRVTFRNATIQLVTTTNLICLSPMPLLVLLPVTLIISQVTVYYCLLLLCYCNTLGLTKERTF
jgi:hypothetical protein